MKDIPPRLSDVTLTGLSLKIDQAGRKLVYNPPMMKPRWWYEYQEKVNEAIERIEAERSRRSAESDNPKAEGE